MYFYEGLTFGMGFAVAVIAVCMLCVLIPGKPKAKRSKISNVRTGKWE